MKNSDILKAVRALPGFSNQKKWFEYKGHAVINECKVYSPELATLLTTPCIPLNPPTDKLNGFDFIEPFTRGYAEGERQFDEWRNDRMAMPMDDLLAELRINYHKQGWEYVCDSIKGFPFIPTVDNTFDIGRDSALFAKASDLFALWSTDIKEEKPPLYDHSSPGCETVASAGLKVLALYFYYSKEEITRKNQSRKANEKGYQGKATKLYQYYSRFSRLQNRINDQGSQRNNEAHMRLLCKVISFLDRDLKPYNQALRDIKKFSEKTKIDIPEKL